MANKVKITDIQLPSTVINGDRLCVTSGVFGFDCISRWGGQSAYAHVTSTTLDKFPYASETISTESVPSHGSNTATRMISPTVGYTWSCSTLQGYKFSSGSTYSLTGACFQAQSQHRGAGLSTETCGFVGNWQCGPSSSCHTNALAQIAYATDNESTITGSIASAGGYTSLGAGGGSYNGYGYVAGGFFVTVYTSAVKRWNLSSTLSLESWNSLSGAGYVNSFVNSNTHAYATGAPYKGVSKISFVADTPSTLLTCYSPTVAAGGAQSTDKGYIGSPSTCGRISFPFASDTTRTTLGSFTGNALRGMFTDGGNE